MFKGIKKEEVQYQPTDSVTQALMLQMTQTQVMYLKESISLSGVP